MSRSDLPLILSSKVQDDFADILQYSLETWGEAQAFAYRAVLHQAVPTIPENPQIGHGRPELSPAHRIFPAGRHSIVYRITDLAILVSRIPRAHGTRPPRVTQA
ncbi:plasmid stabilization system protein [Methylocaldum marinum]|uniref:Plasmid stabilization system protein n=1 Tax=Methylocaldum marinum TaxID=1432792 RepID=A0A250KYZ8_9GAMM|nr:type II toxin-antitoxin system RelE/ParE family toxin [Methylocaldum marinum]BBA36812.1 plasmid stabilization system protein [Methylocaldum marinum]